MKTHVEVTAVSWCTCMWKVLLHGHLTPHSMWLHTCKKAFVGMCQHGVASTHVCACICACAHRRAGVMQLLSD